MLSKIDQKKLLDAGQVDQVKAEITKNFQQQLDEEKQRSQMLEKQLYDSMIGGSFAGSKYIADKIAIGRFITSPLRAGIQSGRREDRCL